MNPVPEALPGPDEKRTVYEGRRVSVTLERWGAHDREIVEHPGAVAIVAVDTEGCVILVRQLREATGGELLELPAGTSEPGEAPLETARRELAEETGVSGGEWREATAFWTTPGFCRERMTLFFAEGVEAGEASPDADESFELVHLPVGEIEGRLGEIEDAKTLVGLLFFLRERENVMLANRSMPPATVVPELPYEDVATAIEWLCGAFGFRERWRAGTHRAQLWVGNDAAIVVMEPGADETGPRSVMVRVGDVDRHFERARRFGARILDPPTDFPYGERQYNVEDPGGHRWTFSQSIADVAPEEWGGRSAEL